MVEGSGMVGERDYCRIPGIISELWEDLPYSFSSFLMRVGARVVMCHE